MTIEIKGLGPLLSALDQFEPFVTEEMRDTTDAAMKSLVGPLATYPPQRPGNKYRRTGTLGRTWTGAAVSFQGAAFRFQGILGNVTPYADYVQGSKVAEGWTGAQESIDAHQAHIDALYQQGIERLFQRLGGG